MVSTISIVGDSGGGGGDGGGGRDGGGGDGGGGRDGGGGDGVGGGGEGGGGDGVGGGGEGGSNTSVGGMRGAGSIAGARSPRSTREPMVLLMLTMPIMEVSCIALVTTKGMLGSSTSTLSSPLLSSLLPSSSPLPLLSSSSSPRPKSSARWRREARAAAGEQSPSLSTSYLLVLKSSSDETSPLASHDL